MLFYSMFLCFFFCPPSPPPPPSSNRKTWVNKTITGGVGGNQMQMPEQSTLQGFSDGAAF